MRTSLVSTILLFIALSTQSLSLQFHDCGPPDAAVRFSNIALTPDPVVFGREVKVDADMILTRGIPEGGFSKLEVTRILNFLGFPIYIRVGCPWTTSCVNDLCTSLSRGLMCTWMKASSNTSECGCPSTSQVISTRGAIVEVPSLGPFGSFFANGLYRVRWTWLNRSMDKELGCVSADINFASYLNE